MVAIAPFGVVGPAGINPAVVQKLDAAFKKALCEPRMVELAQKYSPSPRYMSRAEYTKYAAETFLAEKEVIARLLSTAAATQK